MTNPLEKYDVRREWVRREGARISFQRAGNGPPITLIQGLGLPGAMWRDFAAELVAMGYSVTLPDNRGAGYSDLGRVPLRIEQMADDVAAVMMRAHLEPSVVVGISMGGMIAQHLALRHPQLVRGVHLVSTTPGLKSGKMAAPDTYRLLLKMFLRPKSTSLEDARKLLAHEVHTPRLPELFRRWDAVLAEQPTSGKAFVAQLGAAARHEVGKKIGQLAMPVNIVSGNDDRLIPPQNSIALAERIPHARLKLVDQAGHLLPFEQPDALRESLEDLLRQVE
jgi:pimeloyl-ACP methyl ester carboxylesterase